MMADSSGFIFMHFRKITILFKDTNLNASFSANNIIQQLLTTHTG
jgi:hypothetical protein